MSMPLLTTKLTVPPQRPKLVPRPRLIDLLNQSLQPGCRLTLISAPAGFGKTTLVREWLAACERAVAWLSLDEGDGEPARFLAYVIAALQTVASSFGESVSGLLQSPQPLPAESVLTALLNEIAAIPDNFVLVLDDYHVIDAPAVDQALAFLVERLPPQMHLVIATREDPPLPLARLRARGQLVELRVADLRFTADEASAFLNKVMDLNLSAEEVGALEARTEGWVAGLQLAALAMRGTLAMRGGRAMRGHGKPVQEDAAGFIDSFTGSHRFVLDYLLEEVLEQQPENVQTFLLRTSILDRLCSPLCATILGRPPVPTQETLAYLEQANLFLVPLDNERRWYRYHHLFRDLLRQRLQRHNATAEGDEINVSELHSRASRWHEDNGSCADAIRHALAAEDFERAAGLLELVWRAMDRRRRYRRWLGWVEALPDELVRSRPVLSVGVAWALLDAGNLAAAEVRLQDGERWLEIAAAEGECRAESDGMVVVDREEFRLLPSTIATARTYLAQAMGDVPGSIRYARQAFHLLPEDDIQGRGVASSLLGLALWAGGDLVEGHRTFARAMAAFEKAGNLLYAITGTYILADIRLAQGRLREAVRTYRRSIRLVTGRGEPAIRGTAELYLGLSELLREQGDEEAAAQLLAQSLALSERASLPRWNYHHALVQARRKQAEGEWEAALDLLDEAARHYIPGPVPETRSIAALKARVWLAQGRVAEAEAWARGLESATDGDREYRREFERITMVRLLLGRYRHQGEQDALSEALALIRRLLNAAEAGGRRGSVLELLILSALAQQAGDDLPAALVALERALTLAEPEGYVRLFVDEGPPLARLLAAARARGVMPDYTNRLLAACAQVGVPPSSPLSPAPAPSPLVEPLSARELEVLQLVAQGLTNREIGERLFIALDTVKGHNRRLFGKLQVRTRTEAAARARELGLL